MSEKILGDNLNPKSTVNARTDMSDEWDDAYLAGFGKPEPKEPNLEVGVLDVVKNVGAKGLRALAGAAESFNQATDMGDVTNTMLNPIGQAAGVISDATGLSSFTDPIKRKIGGVARDTLTGAAGWIEGTMSEDAQQAAQTSPINKDKVGDWKLSDDPAVWGMQFANVIGYMTPTIATAYLTRGRSVSPAIEQAVMNKMIKTGASPELARKALPFFSNAIKNSPAVGVGIASDLGSQGNESRAQALDVDTEQLAKSPYFQQAFREIDQDPIYEGMSDSVKLNLAREKVADLASRAAMSDPKNVALSVAATAMGDVPLANVFLKGSKTGSVGGLRGFAEGFGKGAAREAPLETTQEGANVLVGNEVANEYLGSDVNPWQGVDVGMANGLALGGLSGGVVGGAGGVRSTVDTATDVPDVDLGNLNQTPQLAAPKQGIEYQRDLATEPEPLAIEGKNIIYGHDNRPKRDPIDDRMEQQSAEPQFNNGEQVKGAQFIPREESEQPIINKSHRVEEHSFVIDGEYHTIGKGLVPSDKPADVIYGRDNRSKREPVDDHMEQQAQKPQFYNGEQVGGAQFIPRERAEAKADGNSTVIDGEYHTVNRNGAGTQLATSNARPDVIYGHDNRPAQDTTVYDKQVGQPQFEGGMKKSKRRQLEYLAKRREAKIPQAMQALKGAARITRNEYRQSLVDIAVQAANLGNSKSVNPQIDTLSGAITKLGGINRASAESEGVDQAHFKRNRLFPATNGRTFDDLAESLNEYGYTNRRGGKLSANDVLDMVTGELDNNERHYSQLSDAITETDQGVALVDMVREYGADRVQTAIKKALSGDRLGDRQAEIVNEAMDVIETGRIEQAGGIEYRRAERDIRRETRAAKRKQQMQQATSDLGFPDWVTNDTNTLHESDYIETVEAALYEAITDAAIINPSAVESLLGEYDAGQITGAQLMDRLGELDYADKQTITDVENVQSTSEAANSRSDASGAEQRQENSQPPQSSGDRSDGARTWQQTEPSVGAVTADGATSDRQDEGSEVAPSDIAIDDAEPELQRDLAHLDFASLRKEVNRLNEDSEGFMPGRADRFHKRLNQAEDMAAGRSPIDQDIADWAIAFSRDIDQDRIEQEQQQAKEQQALEDRKRQRDESRQQYQQMRQEQLSDGKSDNEREQAYLDTLEDPSTYDKADYAAWIAKRLEEYKQATGNHGDIGQSGGFTAFIRDYADNNLASRLQPNQSVTTKSKATLQPRDFDQQNTKDLKSGAYPLDYHNAIARGIYRDGITQADYLQALNTLIANKDEVIRRLSKYTVPVLRNIVGSWRTVDMKKPQLVQAAWKRLLETYNFNAGNVATESVDMSYFSLSAEERAKIAASKEAEMIEQLRQTTQADLDAYLAKRNKQKAEHEAEKKAEEKALENPVTLQDYRKLVGKKGIDGLTPKQRATFDQLVTDEELAKRKAAEEKQAVKQGFDADDELDINPIEKGTHGKTGEPIFNVSLNTRLGTDKFKEAASFARSLKGGYWRGNFFFGSEAGAQTFINWLKGDDVDLSSNKADKRAEKTMSSTERMEALADRLEKSANEAYRRDRKENTAKQVREADYARNQADKDIATAKTFRAIAKGIKDGSIKYLSKMTAKTQLEMLQSLINQARWRANTSDTEHLVYRDQNGHMHWKDDAPITERVALVKYPFSEINRENLIAIANKMVETKGFVMLGKRILKKERQKTGRMTQLNIDSADTRKIIAFAKANDMMGDSADNFNRLQKLGITTPAMLRTALIELDSVTQKGVEQDVNNAKLASMERDLKRKVIANRNSFIDFFPTPETIANDIIELANIEPGMSVLEPSAGHGMLADAALNAGGDVQTVEMASDLVDILEAKGYKVDGGDFMKYQPDQMYDRIVMNPPFSNDMDIDHVQHAYGMLKPGGRMVAIVSSMAGNRQNKKNKAFREWLDDVAAEEQLLPDNAFKASLNPTSVRTKTLVIEKPLRGGVKQLESDLIKALLNNTTSKQLDSRVAELIERIKEAGGNWRAVRDSLVNADSESGIKNGISLAVATLKSTGQAFFSRESVSSKDKTKGIPLKQAELAVRAWLRQYKGGAGVNVKVVKSQAEAEEMLGTSLNDYKINAFFDEVTATVVVVADNIASTKDLRQKLRHEILVHHGLRAVVGNSEYQAILKTVYKGLNSKFLKNIVADVERDYGDVASPVFVEEILAKAAESERNAVQQWLDRVVARIAQALRKVGLMTPSDITKAELNNIVQTLADRMQSVNDWSPETTPPTGEDGRLSRTKFSRNRTNNNNNGYQSSFMDAVNAARDKIKDALAGPIADVADAGWDIPTENIKSYVARRMADKFQVLKELQRNIKKAGGTLNEDNDAYLAEELFHGKAENDLRKMREMFVKPLAEKLAKYGITQSQLDDYLIARHAQERNDYIASINPKFPDGGSGMMNADAQAKLDEIRNGGKQKQYDELAHIIDAMIAKQRDVLRDSGLETDEMVDTWQSHYKHYVPLKGRAQDESSLPRTGKGFSIGGKESKSAMGRKSRAESPSSHAILDLTEKLVRARKNEVGQALLKLVQDNPSPDYWEVFTNDNPDTAPQIVERKNPLTGEKENIVEDRPVPMSMMPDFYFPTKKNGKIYYIKIKDKRLMQAMRNMGPDNSNGIIRFMAGFNRILASVNTSYNPEFVVGNFARDIQTAILNLSAEQTRDDGKIKGEEIVKKVIKDTLSGKVMRAIHSSLRNKQHSEPEIQEWQRHFEEFMEAGGKTGWFDMKDVEGQAAQLERMIAMANGSYKGKAYKVFDEVTGFVENLNGSIENAVRLSAYVNARKAGISKKKAASLAKNMTVNFNRRGEVSTTLNALYMFANASIQGSANFIRTMSGLNGDGKLKWENLNRAQKLAVGIVGGSIALAFANRSAAGEDDDGENWYDKVPDYVKERNFVIMKSLVGGDQDGSYWTIPMPYGYNVFAVLGTTVEAMASSDSISPAKAAGNMVLATMGAFSPIGMSSSDTVSGTALKNALPTVGKPFFEVAVNENFFGGQIYQENMPFGTQLPNSSLSKRSTGDGYKAVASWLNEATGGSAYRSGWLDLSPDVMQYIVGYFGGAAARFADTKVPGFIGAVAGEDVEHSKVAFLSRISGRVMPYADQSKFYDRRDELMQINDESKFVPISERAEWSRRYGYKMRLLPLLKSSEKQLKTLRQRRGAIYALDIPTKDKDLRLKNVERQMKAVIDRFNNAYHQLKSVN